MNSEISEFIDRLSQIQGLDVESAVDAVGDPALYKTVLQRSVRTLPGYISETDSALSSGDLSTFAVKTHGIKGLLRQIGHAPLSIAGEALEKAAKSGDMAYCRSHYDGFKSALFALFERISAVFQSLGESMDDEREKTSSGDIADYTEDFIKIKAALEDYDSILAAELLEPLTKIEFGKRAGMLIAGTVQALEMYKPERALEHIEEILKLCSKF